MINSRSKSCLRFCWHTYTPTFLYWAWPWCTKGFWLLLWVVCVSVTSIDYMQRVQQVKTCTVSSCWLYAYLYQAQQESPTWLSATKSIQPSTSELKEWLTLLSVTNFPVLGWHRLNISGRLLSTHRYHYIICQTSYFEHLGLTTLWVPLLFFLSVMNWRTLNTHLEYQGTDTGMNLSLSQPLKPQ